jgi:hypothetical protein
MSPPLPEVAAAAEALERHCLTCVRGGCRGWWQSLYGGDYVPASACCEVGNALHEAYVEACWRDDREDD